MHGDAQYQHNHEEDGDGTEIQGEEKVPLPMEGDQLMHGLLMHGDMNAAPHDHGHEKTKENAGGQAPMPLEGDKLMHGLLMHGDINAAPHDHGHGDKKAGEVGVDGIGPDTGALHGILMHGDSAVGHDHSDEDSNTKHEVFRDISQIPNLGLDKDILRIIDLEKLLEKDRKEYADWIINNPQVQDEHLMGSTYASVSDSVLNDIELMKKKYLEKANMEALDIADHKSKEDDIPFTPEDANAVLNEGQGHGHVDENDDIRHDLDLLGSTEPLNARHKVQLELQKERNRND